jgi:hypothetical protein
LEETPKNYHNVEFSIKKLREMRSSGENLHSLCATLFASPMLNCKKQPFGSYVCITFQVPRCNLLRGARLDCSPTKRRCSLRLSSTQIGGKEKRANPSSLSLIKMRRRGKRGEINRATLARPLLKFKADRR